MEMHRDAPLSLHLSSIRHLQIYFPPHIYLPLKENGHKSWLLSDGFDGFRIFVLGDINY